MVDPTSVHDLSNSSTYYGSILVDLEYLNSTYIKSTPICLKGVSKAEMETGKAKADFAKSVASTLDGVDENDIKNIVVTEVFTERRLAELDPDLDLGGWP